jgi:hypothetical protein
MTTREPSESTVPPDPDEEYLHEDLSYHELIQDGGRPVCAMEDLLHILHEPAASHDRPWLSDPDSTNQNGQLKPELRLLSNDHGFPAYRKAVKRHIAPHNFNRPLKLMKDPRKQTEWTTWLEYLNFEQ